MAVTPPLSERRARSSLLFAGGMSILGVALAGTASRAAGGLLLVLGWLAFVHALHSFGRAGSEPN
jgi:hypothetical protein